MVEGMLTVLKNLNVIRFKDLNKYIQKSGNLQQTIINC